jgi:hypothetical protein
MKWRVPKIWQDGTCWILGGGMSLPRMFGVSNSLINEVIEGKQSPSCYSPYLSEIHAAHSIAINQSFRIGSWVDMLFFGDYNFFLQNTNDILLFEKNKVSCHHKLNAHPTVKYVKRDARPKGISTDSRTVCWNANSGAAAISIAANAGAKRIVLLGFDMTLVDGNKHWHNLYQKKESAKKRKINKKNQTLQSTFNRHLEGFEIIERDAKKRNIEILNCSDVSRITQFRKVTLKDLL